MILPFMPMPYRWSLFFGIGHHNPEGISSLLYTCHKPHQYAYLGRGREANTPPVFFLPKESLFG